MSTYLKDALIDEVLRNTNYVPAATLYLALYTADPTPANTGAEVTGGGYARQVITFTAPSEGATASVADIAFDAATANYGTVTHIGILDALTAGNLLFFGALTTPRTITTDNQLIVKAGQITDTLT